MKSQQQIGTYVFQTPFGRIIALRENGVIRARSIRYARSERFKKPVPIQPSTAEIIFPDQTPVCPQSISPLIEKMIGHTNLDNFEVDESTQYLSVVRSEGEKNKLPVVVWIHGGSHEIGCGDIPTSDASEWVKEQDIIVVSVSYRLGMFGFLGGNEERPANLGLFDVIEALKWIKMNIESFGGDAENITLFGQSSGGDVIAHLMISDGIEGLFQRVIIQSAPLGLRHGRQKMSAEFLRRTDGIKNEADVLKMMLAYKKEVPSVIKYGLKAVMPFGLQYGFPPLCREDEAEERWNTRANKFDVLIGLNNDETAFYLKTSEALNTYFGKGFGQKLINKTVHLTTEKIYGKPAELFAENYASAGGNVYLFRIYSTLETNHIGAAHSIDLPLLFGNEGAWRSAGLLKDIPWEYIHENGRKLRALWAEFARNGHISDDSEKPEILKIQRM